jgi:hypothetical protein
MTSEEEIILKDRHKGDFKTLFRIYQSDNKFYQSWYFAVSLGLAILSVIAALLSKSDIYSIFCDHFYGIVFSVIPCLLGFNLGAFILIVGFGSSDILRIITTPLKKQKDYSLYQKLMSVLGISVFIQIFTLALNTLFQLISFYSPPLICINVSIVFNSIALFLLVFSFTFSISQLFIVVKHVFLFGQTIHFFIQHKEIINSETEDKKKNT